VTPEELGGALATVVLVVPFAAAYVGSLRGATRLSRTAVSARLPAPLSSPPPSRRPDTPR
jgi:hypothetical protein